MGPSTNPERQTQIYLVKCSLGLYKPQSLGYRVGSGVWTHDSISMLPIHGWATQMGLKGDATAKITGPISNCGLSTCWPGWMPSQVLTISDGKSPDIVPVVIICWMRGKPHKSITCPKKTDPKPRLYAQMSKPRPSHKTCKFCIGYTGAPTAFSIRQMSSGTADPLRLPTSPAFMR